LVEVDANTIHGRAEDIAKMPEYREKFDFSCARAVAELSVLSEYCIPFLREGGYFISMKGPNEDLSIAENAVQILGGSIVSDVDYSINSDKRRIVTIKKISQTPTKYPRNSAQIKKKHL
jgi:16S rRNA (guanine527-N7)-methyltransferase